MQPYSVNKKAYFDYEILEKFEAGLALTGMETKSIRTKQAKLTGGFVTFHANKAFITNLHIPKYKYASGMENYDPEHSRQLLLHAKEISYLRGKMQEKGLTIIPLSLYNKGRHIKLEIGIAKGKKSYDKRETIKKRELDREISRKLNSKH